MRDCHTGPQHPATERQAQTGRHREAGTKGQAVIVEDRIEEDRSIAAD